MNSRRWPWLSRLVAFTTLGWFVFGATLSRPALAAPRLAVVSSGRPVALGPRGASYGGEFELKNVGDAPLTISRVTVLGDEDDIRSPAHFSVHLADGAPKSVAPGASQLVHAIWAPDARGAPRELFAHAVVSTDDPEQPEVFVGITAHASTWLPALENHWLTWMLLVPLLGAACTWAFRGRPDGSARRYLWIGATSVELLLALGALARFQVHLSRLDGNEGLQFIERRPWIPSIGAEYYVGIDGISAPILAGIVVASLVLAVAMPGEAEKDDLPPLALLFLFAFVGVFVSQDALLGLGFWTFGIVTTALLLARDASAPKGLLTFVMPSLVFVTLSIAILHVFSEPSCLVDGRPVPRTFAMSEWMRVGYASKSSTFGGLPVARTAWLGLALGLAFPAAAVPFHTWVMEGAAQRSPLASAFASAGLMNASSYLFARFAYGILPEATRWGAGVVTVIGAATILHAALCALREPDANRTVAYAMIAETGFALVGIGSLTPQGLTGAVLGATMRAPLWVTLATLIESADAPAARRTKRWGGLVVIGLVGVMGLPGGPSFWSHVSVLFGALPVYRVAGIGAAFGMVLLVLVCLSVFRRMGPFEPVSSEVPARDVPDAIFVVIAPIVAVSFVLGFWPSPLVNLMSASVRDLASCVNPPGPDQIAQIGQVDVETPGGALRT